MMRQAANDMGLAPATLEEVSILGSSRNVLRGNLTRIIADIHRNGDPLTVIQEHAEGIGKYLLGGHVSEKKMTRWLRDTERQTRTRILADNLATMDAEARLQELAEGFSHVAMNNALGRIDDSALPAPVKAFFLAFNEQIASTLHIATDFVRLRREGRVDADFSCWLDVAAGLNAEYQANGIDASWSEASLVDDARIRGGPGLDTFSISPNGSEVSGKPKWDTPEKLEAYRLSLHKILLTGKQANDWW